MVNCGRRSTGSHITDELGGLTESFAPAMQAAHCRVSCFIMATRTPSARAAALFALVSLSAVSLGAQTAIKLPKNRYTPEQDVQLGREAAAEVRKQYPI